MAVKSTPVAQSTTERLRQYREAAKQLQPTVASDNGALAITVGKALADSRNFFTNVASVYKVERELGKL